MSERRVPGPPPRMSRELLVQAGVRAVRQRFRSRQHLEDVLGIRLREITAEADEVYFEEHGERPDPPVSSSTLYRQWGSKEAYLEAVFGAMFSPPNDLAAAEKLLGQKDRPWQEALSAWLDADHAQAQELGPVYLLGFLPAAAGDDGARSALQSVYDGYDQVLRPLLRRFLYEHRLEVTLPEDPDDKDGVIRLSRMLTAITEGWLLRAIADPAACRSVDGRSPWAKQAILMLEAATAPHSK